MNKNIISVTCPNCGRNNTVEPNSNKVTCQGCGSQLLIHNDYVHDPYGDGYSYQQGMFAAQDERNKQLSSKTDQSAPSYSASVSNGKPRRSRGARVARIIITIVICGFIGETLLSFLMYGINKSIENGSERTQHTVNAPANYEEAGFYPEVDSDSDNDSTVTLPAATSTERERPSAVYLTELDSYTSNNFSYISTGEKDIYNNYYHCGLRGYTRETSATWRLNGAYSKFSFIAAVHCRDKGNNGVGSISIYKDGKLIWECLDFTTVHESELVSLDISGCKDLTVTIRCDCGIDGIEPVIFDPTLFR